MRGTKRKKRNSLSVRKQKDVIRDVMLSAGQCGTWLTLDELAKLTQFPPASISAQLRHLGKLENGAFDVDKRVRRLAKALRGDGFGAVGNTECGEACPSRGRRDCAPQCGG